MPIVIFWIMMSGNLVSGYQHFAETLKMRTVWSSENGGTHLQHYMASNQDYLSRHFHRRDNLKSHTTYDSLGPHAPTFCFCEFYQWRQSFAGSITYVSVCGVSGTRLSFGAITEDPPNWLSDWLGIPLTEFPFCELPKRRLRTQSFPHTKTHVLGIM